MTERERLIQDIKDELPERPFDPTAAATKLGPYYSLPHEEILETVIQVAAGKN